MLTFASKEDSTGWNADSDPLKHFLECDSETRLDILLNHPQVEGFIFVKDNYLSVGYFPKKFFEIKGSSSIKTIASISGYHEEYSVLTCSEESITSSALYFTENSDSFDHFPKTKELKEDIEKLSDDLKKNINKSIIKMDKIIMLALPVVLPKIKGFDIIEGDIEDDEVTEKMCNYHPVAIEWLSAITDKFLFNKLLQNDIETPTVHADIKVTSEIDLLLNIPFRSAKPASIYQIMHSKAKAVIKLNKNEDELKNIANNHIKQNNNCNPPIKEVLTSSTSSSISSKSVKDKFEKLTAFHQIFFSIATLDRNNNIESIKEGNVSDNIIECLDQSTTLSDLARNIGDSFLAFTSELKKENDYLSKGIKMPSLTHTTLSYLSQNHYHINSIDANIESLKKTFNALIFLSPPRQDFSSEYTSLIDDSNDCYAEIMLDEAKDKRSGKKKEVFIKGRQSTLDHVLKLLSNIIAFSRFWTGYDPHTKKDLPLIAKIFTDIANELSTSDYQEFHTKYKYIHKHMAHTLVTYIFNIFSQFANKSKNPTNLRELKVNNAIDKSLFEIPVKEIFSLYE